MTQVPEDGVDVTTVSARIDVLLQATQTAKTVRLQSELYHGTLAIMQALYGADSSQETNLRTYVERLRQKAHPANAPTIGYSISAIAGAGFALSGLDLRRRPGTLASANPGRSA